MSQDLTSSRKLFNLLPWLGSLGLLAGITLFLYFPAGHFEFTNWDDGMYIAQNSIIHKLTADRVQKIFSSLIFANYHPVTLLSYAFQYHFFGIQPQGYHWVNIVFHILNTWLVCLIVFQISRSWILSLTSALLFSLHPLQVESVVWVSSHKTLLSAFFSLAAVETYFLFLKHGKRFFYFKALMFYALAVFSKPVAITFPLILSGMDRLSFRTSWKDNIRRILPFLLFAGTELGLVILAHLKEKAFAPMASPGPEFYSVVPLWTIFFYLKNAVFPVHLIALYPPLAHVSWFNGTYAIPALICLTLIVLAFALRKRFVYFSATLIGFIVLLAPTINLLPLSAPAADRYMYLPLLMPVLFFCRSLEKFWNWSKNIFAKSLIASVMTAVVFALFTISRHDLNHWHDSHALWTSVLRQQPGHAMAHIKLGEYYYEKRNVDEAIRLTAKGVSLGLNNPVFAKNLVAMYMAKGEYALARENALAFSKQVPQDERFYIQLGIIESKENPEKALEYFKKATEIKPGNPFAWFQLGRFSLDYLKQPQTAYTCFLKSLALDPYHADFHIAIADCLSQVGSYQQAINVLRYALTLDEHSADAWLNLGNLLKLTGDENASREALQKAREIAPSPEPSAQKARLDYSS